MLRPAFALLSALVLFQSSAAIANEKADVAERRAQRGGVVDEDVEATGAGNSKTDEAAEPAPARRHVLPLR